MSRYVLSEDEPSNAASALFLATASTLSYLPREQGTVEFSRQLGLNAELVSVDNTQAYVAGNDDHLVIAFRGTESPASLEGLKDWLLTDAVNLLILPRGRLGTDLAAAGVDARFHQGFVDALAEIWGPLFDQVQQQLNNRDRPVWVTGHSLGGALALLSAWVLQRQFISVHHVTTFGGPMIGNHTATAALNKEFAGRIDRFVNAPDPVPQLPTLSLLANDYQHCDREWLIGDRSQTYAALLSSLAKDSVQGLIQGTLLQRVWQSVMDRVQAHLMTSYNGLIESIK
jgi:triacylglycerol lipase